MQARQNVGASWNELKQLISNQTVELPAWTNLSGPQPVSQLNSCWVGPLCFLPKVGAVASESVLNVYAQFAPGSRWQTSTAFKGAEFDPTGRLITAVYAVQRIPKQAD
jgi:hypothetical protein